MRGFQAADAGDGDLVDQIAGGEHIACAVGGVEKFDDGFGGGKGDAVELEAAGFGHLAVFYGNVGDDGFADIGLPDADGADAVCGDFGGVHQPLRDGEGADGGGQVAAVAAPIDEGAVDGDLAEEIVDVVIGALGCVENHGFAGRRAGVAQSVYLFAVGVGAAEYAQQDFVARAARFPRRLGQVGTFEKHAF